MPIYADIAQFEASGRSFVLATVVDVQGSTPQKPGSKMLVLEDGTVLHTIGGGAIEKQIVDAAVELLKTDTEATRFIETHLTHDLGMCCGGKMRVFLEKHSAPHRLYVFGAGHVGKELAILAQQCGFKVTVVDSRPEWLNTIRFPAMELIITAPDDFAKRLSGGDTHYACVTTHDHPLDQACLEALLRKPFRYLGVIGSRRKAERFKMRLKAAGYSDAELKSFESPMGLPIGGVTPSEIAVSIVGRLIERRRNSYSQ